MYYILLCGGIGNRINYSLPKPLNYVNGQHSINLIIDKIPSNEIYIIYNIFLDNYNFKEIIINENKNKNFHFKSIDYYTRGSIETAHIGIKSFSINENENICFLDNDSIHDYDNLLINYDNGFIGYSIDRSELSNYSFIKINNGIIENIIEKKRISDNYCCGVYGFLNKTQFLKYSRIMIEKNIKIKNEFYFSELYKIMINDKCKIIPVFFEKNIHIGTINEINNNKNYLNEKKLRICFDLDNTLVTFPTIIGDYSSVKPINKNIYLLKKLKEKGHEIIIHTARRMKTHQYNIGKVVKDIALVTIDTLNKYEIEYDELIFGKPYADIYIDDKSVNPYINNPSTFFGFFNDEINNENNIINLLPPNKYNNIKTENNIIIKSSKYDYIKGELFFYRNIPTSLKYLFPCYYENNKDNEINIENINGIPLYFLYKNKILNKSNIDDLFNILNILHTCNEYPVTITDEKIKNNYCEKIIKRVKKYKQYQEIENIDIIVDNIIKDIEKYFEYKKTVNVIHGDFWFSNIILKYDNIYKLIDMKGIVDDIYTLNGDIYYDYGKFYQSIIGYDLILHNDDIDYTYINEMKDYFLKKCIHKGLNINYLKAVTKSLIFGSFHSINSKHIIDLLINILINK